MGYGSRCHAAQDTSSQRVARWVVGPGGYPVCVEGAAVVLQGDYLLGDVDQPPGEVAAVRGTQSGVGEALSGPVGGDEVLQGGQTFAEAGLDREVNDPPFGIAHQAPHPRHLLDLLDVAFGPGHRHYGNASEVGQPLFHQFRCLVRGVGPGLHRFRVPFVFGDEAGLVLLFIPGDQLGRLIQDFRFLGRNLYVVDCDGNTRSSRVVKAQFLNFVQSRGRLLVVQVAVQVCGQVF